MQADQRGIGRRTFLGATAAAVPAARGRAAGQTAAGPAGLREKFFGCIAGCHIGSSMAAPVEGWPYDRIEKQYGTLERLLPYEHYGNRWLREPGTTEDGVERQKLMITAIIDKQDRVTAEDVRGTWVRDIKPESAGMVSEPFEAVLLAMAKTPIPAVDLGKYCDYAGLVSMARSCHPIGLINAGDVPNAIADVFEVGQLYQSGNSRGLRWAAVTAAGIAAATRPGATVDRVIGAIFDHCDKGVVREIERALKRTADCRDFREMRKVFDGMYSGAGIPYAHSYANEVVTKAVCVFRMTGGNLKETLIAGVNMGRDTDCLTAVATGFAGALSGGASLPAEWIAQSDKATKLNRFTNSQRTLKEHSDGLYEAFRARLKKMKAYAAEMEQA
ncbi:MAG: ADP-ribosylglycohydrolase family protein [Bryobacterales bacterium]|nr:ADP-ribosylglycohydrolase family protein [Bryobacterales bacterium]